MKSCLASALHAGFVLWLVGCGEAEPLPVAKPAAALAAPPTVQATQPTDRVAEDEPPNLWTRQRGSDWPSFLGPNRDSKSPETGIIAPWPAAGLRIVWQRELQTGYGIGSISHGRYYHFERQDERGAAHGSAVLLCLNAESGDELWRFAYPTDYEDLLGYNNGPRCSPIVDGSRVYIYGAEGMLHCLRASDGQPLWQVDTVKKYGVVQNFFGVGSTPIIEGDLLICMVGGSPPGSPGLYESGGAVEGNGSGIVAFDKWTGEERYKITNELASYSSPQLATIDGRRWCFMFARGGLVGFEPTTGQIDFEYPWRSDKLESVNAATPVVVGNEVLVSETYSIGASLVSVRPHGFDLVWQDEKNRREKSLLTHWNTGIYLDGYFYACSGRNPPDADLRCIEWKTGKVQWVEQLPLEVRERSSLLYVDGHFVQLGETGTLKLLKANPQKHEFVSESILLSDKREPVYGRPIPLLKDPCWAAPILAHGLLYVRGDDRLLCLELIPDEVPQPQDN